MNSDEKSLARIIFKVKVLTKDGNSFETFFIEVMSSYNPNFKPVKPQGKVGDRKNDGFDKEKGYYCQVYAPEDSTTKVKKSVDKLKTDFKGLFEYWNSISPIKEFNFVLNDKYKGGSPELEKELSEIQKEYGVKTSSFLCQNLEDILFKLSDDKIFAIIGKIPDPDKISTIQYGVLTEVIDYIMKMEVSYDLENIPENPDFDQKIAFNGLTSKVKPFLDHGRIHSYIIDDFFKYESPDAKNELRNKFNGLYKEAQEIIKDNDSSKSDQIFFYIIERLSPDNRKVVKDSLIVLMAYFFEYCDIFEEPAKV